MWSKEAQEELWNKAGGMTPSAARAVNRNPHIQLLHGCVTSTYKNIMM